MIKLNSYINQLNSKRHCLLEIQIRGSQIESTYKSTKLWWLDKLRYKMFHLGLFQRKCLSKLWTGLTLTNLRGETFVLVLNFSFRLLAYAEKLEVACLLYRVHDILFVLARLGSISLAVLTFWYGLSQAPAEAQVIDLSTGTFNTFLFRVNALVAVGCLQVLKIR